MILKFATLLSIALAKRELDSIPVLDAQNYGKVYRINHPENVKAEDFLAVSEFIELQFQSAVDIWATNKDFIDVHVHNDLEEIFEETLEAFELKSYSTVMIESVRDLIESQKNEAARVMTKNTRDINYEQYNDLDTINAWMDQIADQYDFVTKVAFGTKTYENRDIYALEIKTSKSKDKNLMILTTGIHAREWIGPAHMILYTKNLLDAYTAGDSETVELLSNIDLVISYNTNPDGYVKSWGDNRMWRKTVSNYGTTCDGTDPNRNFDVHWSDPNGASTFPCNDAYKGPEAFSEVETQAQRDFIQSLVNQYDNIAYFDVHAYSQLWMYPYGYTSSPCDDADLLHSMSTDAVNALTAVHGTKYKYGPIATTVYPATGSTADYFYDKEGIRCSFALEMRDTGRYGFLLPANQIKPVAEEMEPAYKIIMQNVIDGNCSKLF